MKSDHAANTFLTTSAVHTAQLGLLPRFYWCFQLHYGWYCLFTPTHCPFSTLKPQTVGKLLPVHGFVMLPCRLYQHDRKEKENMW